MKLLSARTTRLVVVPSLLVITLAALGFWLAQEPAAPDPAPAMVDLQGEPCPGGSQDGNGFALDFYSVAAGPADKNAFFSPTSIRVAFALAYEGARGNTAAEIRDAFGFAADDQARRSGFASLLDGLDCQGQVYELGVANALWLGDDFEPFPQYVGVARDYYDSGVHRVSFVTDEGVDSINAWVAEKTHDRITELLARGSVDESTKLVITNAIYFSGSWKHQFDAGLTTDADFDVSSGRTVSVPTMHLEGTWLNYTKNDLVEMVEMPYAGGSASMFVLLPAGPGGLQGLEDSLTAQNLDRWTDGMEARQVDAYLPKFRLDTSYDLIEPMQELGINDAFGGAADFGGISDTWLYIEQAKHKAFVEVDEEGTEAAAATALVLAESFTPPTVFRADHPFVFLIQDTGTGEILFMGRVADPTAGST